MQASQKVEKMSGKHLDAVRIKKEPVQESQFAEADSSSNSTSSNAAETVTRQSSLQRIQLRKDRVKYIESNTNISIAHI